MKPVQHSGTPNYFIEPVRLYRDDLEELLHLLTGAGLATSLRDAAYEYESLDELSAQRGLRPPALTITASPPGKDVGDLSVSFSRGRAYISSYSADRLGAVPLQVREFLDARRSRMAGILQPWLWGIVAWGSLYLYSQPEPARLPFARIFLPVFIASITLVCSSLLFHRYSVGVLLRRRHEGGFFKRNADRLWLLLVGAAIGAGLSLLIQLVRPNH